MDPICTIKFGSTQLTAPAAATALDIKRYLTAPTSLATSTMKLLHKGKVLGDADVVPPSAKLMLVRCKSPLVSLNVREIVSGFSPKDSLEVPAEISHEVLVPLIVKALRLPPCDEYTEVRLFLPHVGALMRADLNLSDYPQPHDAKGLEIYAVPCPISQKPEELAAHALARAQELKRAQASYYRLVHEAMADGSSNEGFAGRSEAEFDMLACGDCPTADRPDPEAAALHASVDAFLNASDDLSEGTAPDESFVLPAALTEVAGTSDSHGSIGGISRRHPQQQQLLGGDAIGSQQARATLEAQGVPSRLRTGLMPSVDDEPIVVQLPMAVIGELEAMEASCVPPTLAEWQHYCESEERRLEERCADLVLSLAPASPRSPTRSPTLRTQERAAANRRPPPSGTSRRSHSPRTYEHREQGRGVRGSLEEALNRAASEGPDALVSSWSSSGSSLEGSFDPKGDDSSSHLHGDGLSWTTEAAEDASAAPPPPPHSPQRKPHRRACKECGCRLPLTACASACKCGSTFCAKHMHCHECPVEYQELQQRKLREDNPAVAGHKLERF